MFINKILSKFSLKRFSNGRTNEKSLKDPFLAKIRKKEVAKKLFKDIKYRDLSKTPVFLTLITIIFITNCLVYFLVLIKNKIGLEGLDSSLYPLFFGANHFSSIIEGKQVWRLFTFVFIENNSSFFQFIISLVFVWFTFSKIGFFQELFLGTKKSLIIWGFGVLVLSLTQFVLTKNEAVYYYGTEYLSWISIGALTYLIVSDSIKNDQARALITSTLIKGLLLLIIFAIIKYTNIEKSIEQDNELLRITGFYIAFPVLAFFIGFSITLILNYKKVNSNIALYGVGIFFILLLIILGSIGIWSLRKINLGTNTWDKIKNFY